MEAFVHDINSMTSGNRITTVNIGTDTSAEGRMITKNLLSAIKNGLGSHAQPKSPVVVFKVKNGVNYKEKDKNNDLFNKAVELSAQSENIAFSFIDAQYNAQFYEEGDFNTEVAYFADGARIMDNFVDKEKAVAAGRGTLSTTVINLPRIALKSGNNKKEFFDELDRKMTMIKDQMLERFEIQSKKKVLNFPFLMGQNVWIDSERIEEDNKVKKHLKHGNMRITFLGLNEALILMTGKGHDESRNSQELGLSIVAELRKKVDEYSEKYGLNFVLAGEESEHVAKEFLDIDRAIFGKIKNVTDKEMYTSSFNIPDQKDLDKKLKIEAPYHEYTNGGHVMTIDTVKSDSEKAIEEMHEFIKEAYKNEVGLLEVRHSK
jgi:ribonucleoside-triphosphate reductase